MEGKSTMESTPKISVIVPVYRVEAYLPKCLRSILNQSFRDLEVILVDDGSPDRCGEICDEYAERDSRIRVIHKENGGLSSARNAGLDIARGEYVAFVDSDDEITADCYEKLLSCAERNRVRLVCAGRWDVSQRTGERKAGLCPQKEEMISGVELTRRIFTWESLDSSACDKLYLRELFDGIRYPLGKCSEDIPVTYRLALAAEKAALCPERVYCYVHREGSITYTRISEKTFDFSDHGQQIYEFIRERYPELTREARYLRDRGLQYNVKSLDLALPEDRNRFRDRYRASRKALFRELPFLWKSRYVSRRERGECALLALGLYRSFRRAYYFVRRRPL